jgi:hypothetical protein
MVLVCVAAVTAGVHGQDAVRWRVEDGGNGHWYRVAVVSTALTWSAANAAATEVGSHLASISSAEENAFVRNLSLSTPGGVGSAGGTTVGPWIGAHRDPLTGILGWSSGEPWSFTAWCGGEPTGASWEDAVCYYTGSLCWNDRPGDFVGSTACRSAVQEWSADCNGDGIVDYGQCRDGSLPDYNGNNIPDCCEAGTPCAVGSYPVQWRVEDGGNGHWYAIRASGLPPFSAGNWEALRALALAQGGGLAQVETGAENLFVLRVLDPTALGGEVWAYLGATHDGTNDCSSTTWRWLDGSALSYLNWAPGQPNCLYTNGVLDEPRLAIRSVSGAWGDWSPVELTRGVVEWSADCNNDGLVDYGQILTGQLADTNQNGVPDACEADPCPGDITRNGTVNGTDLAAILAAWGSDGQSKFDCDVDNSGVVDGGDLAFVLAGWGACP